MLPCRSEIEIGTDALPFEGNPVGRSANGAKYNSQWQARSASLLVRSNRLMRALKVRNIIASYYALSELRDCLCLDQGRRASLCSALAPGYHIPRLWRCQITRFGAPRLIPTFDAIAQGFTTYAVGIQPNGNVFILASGINSFIARVSPGASS